MAITRETLRLQDRVRISIARHVDQTTRDLVRAWARAWDELRPEWDAALADLVSQSQDGRWPSRATIYRAERAIKALDATRNALEDLAEHTDITITGQLPDLTAEAAAWEAQLMATQLPPEAGTQAGLTLRFSRVSQQALNAIVTRTTQQITALTLPLSAEATASMNSVLIRGIAVGDNPRTAARLMVRRVEGAFNGGLNRAMVIARTEMLDAHRNAGRAQDVANIDVLRGWIWSATLDTRTCPSCWAMHGEEFPPDASGPNDHQQGRCARIPALKSWRELGFNVDEPPDLLPDAQRVFKGLPERDQLQIMGSQRLQLLRSGQTSWGDLSRQRNTPGWRASRVPTPVRDLAA